MSTPRPVLVVLGNQLFPLRYLRAYENATIFMAEDRGLCTYVRHHQQKIVLFLAAMRLFARDLRTAGFDVDYHELGPARDADYEQRLAVTIKRVKADEIIHFEIEDRAMERRIVAFAKAQGLRRTEIPSPMFLCSRESFASFIDERPKPSMAAFYKRERLRLGILLDEHGKPAGGRWSFDSDNRRKLPQQVTVPEIPTVVHSGTVREVIELVRTEFHDHPGDANEFWWPTTRDDALAWLDRFVVERLAEFGPYEDAIARRSDTVFHSVLSPLLNIGLLTPAEVVERVLSQAEAQGVPLQSTEGYVRQVIGWREFIRGIYRQFGEQQEASNFWSHGRELTEDWYTGSTGIEPLDDTIRTALRRGWTHHIPRLMIAANLMTLCEIRPAAAHDWFMEMFVDSSEWVMGPNVYGMGLFSDGGVFATKPYICGSNYLLKMSDYRKGPWCDVLDGLYWRFIARHREFFARNPRLALMPKALDRLSATRKTLIFRAAEQFLQQFTRKRDS
jgi:deoxyribodipyrimidine photolyase-related protein